MCKIRKPARTYVLKRNRQLLYGRNTEDEEEDTGTRPAWRER